MHLNKAREEEIQHTGHEYAMFNVIFILDPITQPSCNIADCLALIIFLVIPSWVPLPKADALRRVPLISTNIITRQIFIIVISCFLNKTIDPSYSKMKTMNPPSRKRNCPFTPRTTTLGNELLPQCPSRRERLPSMLRAHWTPAVHVSPTSPQTTTVQG